MSEKSMLAKPDLSAIAAPRSVTPVTQSDALRTAVITALKHVEDPEIPVNIVDMGLIYGIAVKQGNVNIAMTLTAVGCPAEAMLRADILKSVAGLPGVDDVAIKLVWNPPWTSQFMSDEGRWQLLALGITTPETH